MIIDYLLTSLALFVAVTALVCLSKKIFDVCHPRLDLQTELVKKDNPAVALAVCGYLLGIVFALSGVFAGQELSLVDELIDLAIYGGLAVVLLNISLFINDRVIFHRFDNHKELVDDRNIGLGAIEGAFACASGLVIAGALHGDSGGLLTASVFWLLGQVTFLLMTRFYNLITPFDFIAEVEKDNAAVAFAFAGLLLATANLVRVAITADFVSWQDNLIDFAVIIIIGLLLLPVLRFVIDKFFLPEADLTHELVSQEKPNVGVGLLEASTYLIVSLIIGWIVS